MPEYTRELFMANGEMLAVSAFEDYFSPRQTYIYEVFRIIQGIPLFIEDHLDRFFQTTVLAGTVSGCSRKELLGNILKVIRQNGGNEGNIKISIVPGKSGTQNLLIYFTPHQYPTKAEFSEGVSVGLLEAIRDNPNAKVMDIPLRKETDNIKQNAEVYEVLLVDRNGNITEGSRSNVFFINGDEVITPPLESVLPGVTRKHIIGLCTSIGIRLTETPVQVNNIGQFDALFLSGTSRKVLPIRKVEDHIFPVNNLLLLKISELFNNHVEKYIKNYGH
jgi:branched-chain amino acid aminotransferase